MQPSVIAEAEVQVVPNGAGASTAGRLLPGLLVAALIAADCVVYARHDPMAGFPTFTAVAYLALAFSQLGLVTIWSLLARENRLLRLLAAASVISVLTIGLMKFEQASDPWIVLIGIHLVTLAVPLRLADVVLDRTPVAQGVGGADPEHVQFSLKHLFLGTTAVAMLLAMLRATEFALWEIVIFCAFGLLMAAIGWIAVWSVFGSRRPVVRGAVLLLFGPALGGLIAWLVTGQLLHTGVHAGLHLLQSLLLAGSLLVLRLSGYRLCPYSAEGGSAQGADDGGAMRH